MLFIFEWVMENLLICMLINDMRVCGCLLAKVACLCVYVFCHSCYWVWMCRRGGRDGGGERRCYVYVCRTMLLLLYVYGCIQACIWQGTNQSLVGFQYKSLDLSWDKSKLRSLPTGFYLNHASTYCIFSFSPEKSQSKYQ